MVSLLVIPPVKWTNSLSPKEIHYPLPTGFITVYQLFDIFFGKASGSVGVINIKLRGGFKQRFVIIKDYIILDIMRLAVIQYASPPVQLVKLLSLIQ